jgi:hypothetical protein
MRISRNRHVKRHELKAVRGAISSHRLQQEVPGQALVERVQAQLVGYPMEELEQGGIERSSDEGIRIEVPNLFQV